MLPETLVREPDAPGTDTSEATAAPVFRPRSHAFGQALMKVGTPAATGTDTQEATAALVFRPESH